MTTAYLLIGCFHSMRRAAAVALAGCCIAVTAAGDGRCAETGIPGMEKVKKRFAELFPEATLEKGSGDQPDKKRVLTQKEIDGLKQSVVDLKKIMETYPGQTAWCAKTQNQIGETYRDMGEYGTAIAEYEKVLAGYPAEKTACAEARQGIETCRALAKERAEGEAASEEIPAPKDVVNGGADVAASAEPSDATSGVQAGEPHNPDAGEFPAGDQYVITFRDGRTVRGEVIKETDTSLTVRAGGSTMVLDRHDIATYEKAQ